MNKLVPVTRVDAISPGGRIHFDLGEESVILFNLNGAYYCIADLCTHDGGPLEDGELVDCQVECPRHGARFDIRTGKVTRLPAVEPIPTYQVSVEDGIIYIELPEFW